MSCPDRSATALAIEIDWPSATMVSASATVARSGSRCHSMRGACSRGSAEPTAPTVRAAGACSRWSSAQAAAVPATRPSSMAGQRGARRREASVTATVTAAVATAVMLAPPSTSAARSGASAPWEPSG